MSDREKENRKGTIDDPVEDGNPSTIQEKVEEFFNQVFGKWGILLANHPGKVFTASVCFFILLSMGMAMRTTYEDENLIWTPDGNLSLESKNKGDKLFPSKGGFISMIAEVKDPSKDDSIITLGALNEIKQYVDRMEKT